MGNTLTARFGNVARAVKQVLMPESKADSPFDSPRWGGSDGSFTGGQTFDTQKQLIGAYTQLEWVSIAVDNIVRDFKNREFWFEDLKGNVIEQSRIDDISSPFSAGFAGQNIKEILATTLSHTLLGGNGYLWRAPMTRYGQINSVPEAFIQLHPGNVKPKISANGLTLEYYEVSIGYGQVMRLSPEEVIHFRQNTLFSPYYGVGNVTKIRLLAQGSVATAEYQNEFMERKASPSAVISDSEARNPDDIARIGAMVEKKWQGKENAGKVFFMSGKDVKVQTIGLSQRDMQFLEGKEYDRQTILSMFGVPLSVAGIPDANYATAKQSWIQYLMQTVNDKIGSIEDQINISHVQKMDPNIRFKMKKYVLADVDDVIKQVQAGLITPNRGSELLGENPDENDPSRNTFYMPITQLPISTIEATPVAGSEAEKGADNVKILSDPRNVEAICEHFVKSAKRPKRFQVKFIRAALRSRSTTENKYAAKISSFFEAQKKRVVKALNESDVTLTKSIKSVDDVVGIIYDPFGEEEKLLETIRPLHTSGVQKAVGDLNSIAGVSIPLTTSNPYVKAAISRLGKNITGNIDSAGNRISVADTTLNALRGIISKGIDEDWTTSQLQEAIESKYDQWAGYRARMIARTESRAAWDAGAEVGYKDLGINEVDVVGCTQFESNSDCGRQDVPINQVSLLKYHPNHIGVIAPSLEP